MKKITDQRAWRFGLICFAFIVTSRGCYAVFGYSLYRWMAWNLFLAFLSLVFSTLFLAFVSLEKATGHRLYRILYVVSFLLWFAFFPNAPYMVTDLIHVSITVCYLIFCLLRKNEK